MARWNDLPWREDVYAAAEVWKERCLLQDGALFDDKNIWTLENLQTLQELVVFNADWSANSFRDKLFKQLNDAQPNIFQLTAELVWLIFLFPLGQKVGHVTPSIKAATKLKKTGEILGWAHLPMPTGKTVTVDALSGIGRTGMFYKKYFHAIRYMLQVFIAFKQFPIQRRTELLQAQLAWEFAEWSDNFKQEAQVPFRHALLFFLFPDSFERMVSFNHKKEVVRDHWQRLSLQNQTDFFTEGGFQVPLAVDKAIFLIRKDLEQEHGTTELDFYRGVLDGTWGMEKRSFPSRPQAGHGTQNSQAQEAKNNGDDANRLEDLEEIELAGKKLSEGELKLLQHYRRERRPQLRELKLKAVEREFGYLLCECCGTGATAYPLECRTSVFEVHHKRPLAEGSTMTGVDDLALLCANCHRAIHACAELPSVEAFCRKIRR